MAKTIEWSPQMSVGVEEIDNQHKSFIQIMADFYYAFNEGMATTKLEEILNRLISYAEFHFKTEEEYFDKFNYEFKDDHKKKHQELKQKAFNFRERFDKEGPDIIPDFMDFLSDWLVTHLETEDQKYVKCFHDNGLF